MALAKTSIQPGQVSRNPNLKSQIHSGALEYSSQNMHMNNYDAQPSNTTNALIGKQIRVARKIARMTQSELAVSLKLSAQQIQKYESGHNRISAGTLYHVAKSVGRPVSFFYELKPHLSPKEEADRLRAALAEKLAAIDDTTQLSVLLNVARVFR